MRPISQANRTGRAQNLLIETCPWERENIFSIVSWFGAERKKAKKFISYLGVGGTSNLCVIDRYINILLDMLLDGNGGL